MPVIAAHSVTNQDLKPIAQWLTERCQSGRTGDPTRILSISLKIPNLDPLVALTHLCPSQQPHVYLEYGASGQAVVAIGAALQEDLRDRGRFHQSRQVVNRWTRQVERYVAPSLATALGGRLPATRIFSTFTFFATQLDLEIAFPSARLLLPDWQICWQDSVCFLTANLVVTTDTDLTRLLARLETQLERIHRTATIPWIGPAPDWAGPRTLRPAQSAGSYFQRSVQRAITHIDRHRLHKIVLAHVLDLLANQPFHIPHSLDRLRQRYPDCAVFAIGNGRGKTFIGASPERLLSIRGGTLITDALAGSAPRGRQPQEDQARAEQLLNNPKERGEHQFVVDFLMQRLTGLGLNPHCADRPTLRRLSNIQHLHTPIQAQINRQTHPLDLVEALHPTPAVAGVPTQAACDQIQRFERFDRSLYAAPLGWIDTDGDSEFMVGIRSALIAENWARLYAGAGIVAGSDPVREWAELKLKFRALSEALM